MVKQATQAGAKSVSGGGASSLSIWAAMLAVYIVWGSTYLAIRFAIETMPPFLMASTRFLLAGAILYAFRRLRGDPAPTRIEWRSAAIVGLFLLVGGNGGVVWAEQFVESGVAALLVGSAPLWMVLLDAFRPGQAHLARKSADKRQRFLSTAGVVIGFLGIGLLVSPSSLTGIAGEVDPLGAAVLTLACFFWAVGSLYNRGAKLPSSPLLGTGAYGRTAPGTYAAAGVRVRQGDPADGNGGRFSEGRFRRPAGRPRVRRNAAWAAGPASKGPHRGQVIAGGATLRLPERIRLIPARRGTHTYGNTSADTSR